MQTIKQKIQKIYKTLKNKGTEIQSVGQFYRNGIFLTDDIYHGNCFMVQTDNNSFSISHIGGDDYCFESLNYGKGKIPGEDKKLYFVHDVLDRMVECLNKKDNKWENFMTDEEHLLSYFEVNKA